MAAEEAKPTDLEPEPEQDALSWRRVGEFIRNVLRLERSIEALKRENKEFNRRIGDLQRKVDEQAGQLTVLLEFVEKALDERVASRAEDVAIRAFERMASAAGLGSSKKSRRKDQS